MASSSNEFLSGDADSSLSIMNSLKISDASDYNKKSGMKIEVIGGEDSYDDGSSDEEDECPPPLQSSMGSATSPGIATSMEPAEESLMEQMMADALRAKHELERKKNETMRKQAKSSFGFKKGFLNSNKKSTKKKVANSKSSTDSTSTRQPKTEQTEPIYELDSEGNILPVANHNQTKKDSLRIAEVQEAMDNQSWQQAFASKSQINSPEFLQQIMNNPRLVKSMSNPKCIAALEALEKNPKEALKRFKGHDEVMEFLNEICGLLGNHFTKLGEMDNSSPKENPKEDVPMVQELREPTEKDVGPIAYKAIQKEKERKKLGHNASIEHNMSKEEKDRVDAIMKNEELTMILMDTDMQQVMQECSQIPGKMQYYMRHEVYGAKLRKLIHAGLLRVA